MKNYKSLIIISLIIVIITSLFILPVSAAGYSGNYPSIVPGLSSNTSTDETYGGHAGYYLIKGSAYNNANIQPYIPFRTLLNSRSTAWANNQWNAFIFQSQGTNANNYEADGVIYYYFNNPQTITYAEAYTIHPESAGIGKPEDLEIVVSDDGETWTTAPTDGLGIWTTDKTKKTSEGKVVFYINYSEGTTTRPTTKKNYWGIRIKRNGAEFTGLTKIYLSNEMPEHLQNLQNNEKGYASENTYLTINENGYIKTGVNATQGQTFYINCILPDDYATRDIPLMGQEPDYGRSLSINNGILRAYKSSNDYGTNGTIQGTPTETEYQYKLDTNGAYQINNNEILKSVSATADYCSAREIYIGKINGNSATADGLKIKSAKIISSDGTTTLWDGIACIDTNGNYCMYDRISGKYFYRNGHTNTGEITIQEPDETGGPQNSGGGSSHGFGYESDNEILQSMLNGIENHLSNSLFFDDLIEFKNILLSIFQEDYSSGQAGLDALGVFNITMRRPTVTEVHEFGNDTIGSWTQEYERPTSDIDYGLNNQRIADFSWFFGHGNYRGVKYYTDIIISGFLWIVFAWYLWHNMPTIIGGDVMSVVSTGVDHENKVYTAKKRKEKQKQKGKK